jgi:hypothetical protein
MNKIKMSLKCQKKKLGGVGGMQGGQGLSPGAPLPSPLNGDSCNESFNQKKKKKPALTVLDMCVKHTSWKRAK